jgi:5-methyltetrahydrofolate--homocysteine methyltransferase
VAEGSYLQAVKEAIVKLDFAGIVKATQEALNAGIDPGKVVTEGFVPGMVIVGEKFEKCEYFLSELVVAAEVMKEGMKVIQPHLKEESVKKLGKVVLATVEGDLHDIGKNIVGSLLKAQGFEVIDLGINVPPDRIISAVKEHQPGILGMSALLTITMPKMGEAIESLKQTSLRQKVKVIVGGAAVTPAFAEKIGADYCAANAVEGVKKCVQWATA